MEVLGVTAALAASYGDLPAAPAATSALRAAGVAEPSLRTTTLEVELWCERFLNVDVRCSTIVSGGNGSYSYSWIGAQPISPGTAIADCYYGQYHYVEVLVTDSNENTGDAWMQMQC